MSVKATVGFNYHRASSHAGPSFFRIDEVIQDRSKAVYTRSKKRIVLTSFPTLLGRKK